MSSQGNNMMMLVGNVRRCVFLLYTKLFVPRNNGNSEKESNSIHSLKLT